MRFFERQETARAQTLRLLLLFGLTLVALLLAVNGALALAWRVVTPGFSGYPGYFFTVNTSVTLLFVLGGWWLETSALSSGGEALARRVGAREAWPASREAEQKLCNIVSELAIAASMKPPLAMVLPRLDAINAFAAGWSEDDAVVAVTQGALDKLTRDELQGLVAHELSHLREGDTRLNMRLAGMVFGLEMIFNLGRSMCGADANGQRSFLALPGFPILVAGSLGWLAGRAPCSSRAAAKAWAACCARWPEKKSRAWRPRAACTRRCSTCCWSMPAIGVAGSPATRRLRSASSRSTAGPWAHCRCGMNCRRGLTRSFERSAINDELVPSKSPMVRMPGVTRRTEVLDTPYRAPRAQR
jgi:Zn-dependent protease with chaperone function